MPRSEDYLDSLLDSVTENKKKPQRSERNERKSASSDSQFLREFEEDILSDIDSGDEDFLADFERDMGFEIGEGTRADRSEKRSEKRRVSLDDVREPEDDFLSDITEDAATSTGEYDDIDEGLRQVISDAADGKSESDDIMDNLANIMQGGEASEAGAQGEAAPEPAPAGGDSEPKGSDAPEPAAGSDAPSGGEDEDVLSDVDDAGEDGVMSDIDGEEAPQEAATPSVMLDDDEEEAPAAEDEAAPTEAEGEAGSGEDVMDIGELLDSLEEDGTLKEEEKEKPAGTLAEDMAPTPTEGEGEGEEGEEKVSFIKKLLNKLLGKKKKGEEGDPDAEDAVEGAAAVVAAVSGEPEEEEEEAEPEDKKAAKKAEKERKKKEKEEAKKKAKEEKAAKAKEPKEKKKKKKKEPDTSPKIPIIVIIPFVLLAVSLFILWNVLKDNISYTLTIRNARFSYDSGDYVSTASILDGVELSEDDLLLGQRAELLATLDLRIRTCRVYSESVNLDHLKALDSLVRGVVYYNDHMEEAEGIAIKDAYDELGLWLTNALKNRYELTAEDAYELMEIRDKDEYTKTLYDILEARGLWSLDE